MHSSLFFLTQGGAQSCFSFPCEGEVHSFLSSPLQGEVPKAEGVPT